MRKLNNLLGKVYFRLTVIEQMPREIINNKLKPVKWKCLCSCGKTKILVGYNWESIKSCGCLTTENAIKQFKAAAVKRRKPDGETSCRATFRFKRADAKRRKINFDIAYEDFVTFSKDKCHYCSAEPKQCINFAKFGHRGNFLYNGLDRIDSDKGYVIDNIVTCCRDCNCAKASLSYNDFLNLIKKIYVNLKLE